MLPVKEPEEQNQQMEAQSTQKTGWRMRVSGLGTSAGVNCWQNRFIFSANKLSVVRRTWEWMKPLITGCSELSGNHEALLKNYCFKVVKALGYTEEWWITCHQFVWYKVPFSKSTAYCLFLDTVILVMLPGYFSIQKKDLNLRCFYFAHVVLSVILDQMLPLTWMIHCSFCLRFSTPE